MPIKIEWMRDHAVAAYCFYGTVTMADMLALAEEEKDILLSMPSDEHKKAIFNFTSISVLDISMIPLLGKLAPIKGDRLSLVAAAVDNSYCHALVTGLSIMMGRSLAIYKTLDDALAHACAPAQDNR